MKNTTNGMIEWCPQAMQELKVLDKSQRGRRQGSKCKRPNHRR